MQGTASRGLILIISLLLLAGPFSGYARSADTTESQPATAAADSLKVAILAPLTGAVPVFGSASRDGALLAIEQQNAGGGILGLPIAPIIEDTACSASMAVDATHKVIDTDGVRYILGDVCSSSSIPMSEVTNAAGVIQMTPTATNPWVTVGWDGKVKDYVFRASFIDPFQGAAAAWFAQDTLSAQKAFVLFDPDNAYVQGLADAFTSEFDKSGTIGGREAYHAGVTNFSTILGKIAIANPDVVYLPDFPNIVNLVTAQAKARGITTPFIGGDGWDSNELDTAAAGGSYFTTHFSLEDPRPEVSAFDQAFRGRFGHAPDVIAALSYDAARLLFQAMQDAGTLDTAVVRTKLAGITHQGVTGTIYFDGFHDPVKSTVMMRVQPGGAHLFSHIPPHKPLPRLAVNFDTGSPGSFFTAVGSYFQPNGTAFLTVNGHATAEAVQADGAGGFVLRLGTTGADEGRYSVSAAGVPSATSSFTLDASAPLRPPEAAGTAVEVPAGIANTRIVHMPVMRR